MFRPTDKQISLLECQFLLPAGKVERLTKSWAEAFQKRILPLIDEETFRDAFSEDNGRPNKSVKLLVGLHLLKEWNDLTDEQVLDQLEYNLQWQYALAVQASDAHVCQKTLHNFRVLLLENDRAQQTFIGVTAALAEADGLGLGKQRLDSTHVMSNIAVLTRLGLFVETVTNFLKDLRGEMPEKLAGLDGGYLKRYLEREGYFADAKREQARRRLAAVANDLLQLVRSFEGDEDVRRLESYRLLVRLFEEQCEEVKSDSPTVELEQVEVTLPAKTKLEAMSSVDKGGSDSFEETIYETPSTEQCDSQEVEDEPAQTESSEQVQQGTSCVRLKEGSEISSASLQSPYDPDATYGHKGKGYEVQVRGNLRGGQSLPTHHWHCSQRCPRIGPECVEPDGRTTGRRRYETEPTTGRHQLRKRPEYHRLREEGR